VQALREGEDKVGGIPTPVPPAGKRRGGDGGNQEDTNNKKGSKINLLYRLASRERD